MTDKIGEDNVENDFGQDGVGVQAKPQAQAAEQQAKEAPEPEQTRRPTVSRLEAVIELARRGRTDYLPQLRQALDQHPELWMQVGSLTLQAQETWLQLIAGKDLYAAETFRRHLDSMRSELGGASASPLERILIDRILACHVQVLYFESHEAQNPGGQNPKFDKYRAERQNQAHRQFLSAVKMLATVRNLVARTNVIQIELLHPPAASSPVAPSMYMHDGEQANGFSGRVDRFNGHRMAAANGVGAVMNAHQG